VWAHSKSFFGKKKGEAKANQIVVIS